MLNISEVLKTLKAEGVNCCLVGGLAVALHGAVRGTVDIDLVIEHSERQFVACEKALRSLGLVPRLPVTAKEVFQFRTEYIKKRNLIAWSFIHPKQPLILVDIIITHNLQTMRTTYKKFGSSKIPVLDIDDLIGMKKASGRPQDLEDIKMLKAIQNAKKN
jgi:hypothetical protein